MLLEHRNYALKNGFLLGVILYEDWRSLLINAVNWYLILLRGIASLFELIIDWLKNIEWTKNKIERDFLFIEFNSIHP